MAEWLGEGGRKMAECGMEAPDLVHVRQMVFSALASLHSALVKPPLPPSVSWLQQLVIAGAQPSCNMVWHRLTDIDALMQPEVLNYSGQELRTGSVDYC